MTFSLAMLVALAIDALAGWPSWLYRAIGHPATWIGALIGWLDRTLNRDNGSELARRLAGIATVAIVVSVAAVPAAILQGLLPDGWTGVVLIGVLAWPLVAARSLYDHVAAVARPLAQGDLGAARGEVAMIVGRETACLDEAGVSRAALESLAENTSDGIIAPLFWGAIFGLPGIAAYKAINTMDSMIGYRTPRHEAFGWAAARLDDLVNLVPARLTGLLFALASLRTGSALRAAWKDAHRHRSPNAGYPEAALAGGLGVRLSGPRVYEGKTTEQPWLNATGRDADASDLNAGLRVYVRCIALAALSLAAVSGFF